LLFENQGSKVTAQFSVVNPLSAIGNCQTEKECGIMAKRTNIHDRRQTVAMFASLFAVLMSMKTSKGETIEINTILNGMSEIPTARWAIGCGYDLPEGSDNGELQNHIRESITLYSNDTVVVAASDSDTVYAEFPLATLVNRTSSILGKIEDGELDEPESPVQMAELLIPGGAFRRGRTKTVQAF
jgi:hypothetical protein